ncbi:YbaM family protein [Marinomonas dokdonensis]|uniref:YbaM family protein n=1 Tax=Marinomonas dokdonensis TaxID=328224 RepID=UPI0040553D88
MMNLENAPQHIQLAVDLIELLETNQVADDVAVEALRIVLADYERKLLDKND